MEKRKVLFLDDCNGHCYENPIGTLVEIPKEIDSQKLTDLENLQIGKLRQGGDWKKILKDGKIEHKVLVEAKFRDYATYEYDFMFKLTSGNY